MILLFIPKYIVAVTFKKLLFIFGCTGSRCCVWASSNCGEQGLLSCILQWCTAFSLQWLFLLLKGSRSKQAQQLWHRRSCSRYVDCPRDQDWTPNFLYCWQTDPLLQSHLGSPFTLLIEQAPQQVLFIYFSMYSKEHQLHRLFLGFELEKKIMKYFEKCLMKQNSLPRDFPESSNLPYESPAGSSNMTIGPACQGATVDILGTALCLADAPVHCGQHSFSEIVTIIIGSFFSYKCLQVFTSLPTTGCGTCKSHASSLSLSFFIGTVMMLDSMTLWTHPIVEFSACGTVQGSGRLNVQYLDTGLRRPGKAQAGVGMGGELGHCNHSSRQPLESPPLLRFFFQHSGITISGLSHLF